MTHNIQSVFYDLLDQHNRIITSDSVKVDINKPIDELKRVVYIDNSNQPALELCDYTNLFVYPPGSTDYSGQSISDNTRIYQLLSSSQPDDSIILVARPPTHLLYTVQSAKLTPTVESLTQWFISLVHDPRLHLQLKADHRVPWPLDPYNNQWQLTSRDDALINFVQCLFTRWFIKEKSHVYEDRRDNPLLVVHGSPGCGKSRFLDEVAKLMVNKHRLQQLQSHIVLKYLPQISLPGKLSPPYNHPNTTVDPALFTEFLQYYSNCIPITTTYNSPTRYCKAIDDETPDVGIALRVLLSYFYTAISNDDDWLIIVQQFENAFQRTELDLTLAIYTIKWHSQLTNCNVLLLIDELMKCSRTDNHNNQEPVPYNSNLNKVMQQVGSALYLNSVLVSTLDQVALTESIRRSGRNIEYIQLKPVDGLLLFDRSTCLDVTNVVVRRLISDCNGHPHTLKLLNDTYNNPRFGWPELLSFHLPYLAYRDMLQSLGFGININLSIDEVVPALLCMKVQLSDKAWFSERTYSDLVAEGRYINSKGEDMYVIPTLSYIALYRFAVFAEFSESEIVQLIGRHLRDIILHDFNFNQSFEHFHAHWEALRRTVQFYYDTKIHHPTRLRSILDYYNNPFGYWLYTALYNRHEFATSSFMVGPTELKQLDHQWRVDTVLSMDNVIMPGDNNPGFDLAIPVSGVDGNGIANTQLQLIELKYSQPQCNSTIDMIEIRNKHKQAMKCIGNNMLVNNVYLIFVCYRNLQLELKGKTEELPRNVLVLDRNDLDRLYGPSLVSRPHLICPL